MRAASRTGVGSGGGTYGDLPIDHDPNATPSLRPIVPGWSFLEISNLAPLVSQYCGPSPRPRRTAGVLQPIRSHRYPHPSRSSEAMSDGLA
jgi:hypothetical protein